MNATAWDTWNIYAIPLQKSAVQRGQGRKAYGKTADGKGWEDCIFLLAVVKCR